MDLITVKENYPIGKKLIAKVLSVYPFGAFLDLGYPNVIGLIKITDLAIKGFKVSDTNHLIVGQELSVKVLNCLERSSSNFPYEVIFEIDG